VEEVLVDRRQLVLEYEIQVPNDIGMTLHRDFSGLEVTMMKSAGLGSNP
jgi:hypothetical protein